MMKPAFFAILLFSFACAAFPASACESVSASTILNSSLLPSAGPTIAVIMLLAILIIVFAYMVGSVVGNTNWIVFAKDELYHLLFSACLLAAIGGILFFSCTLGSALADYSLSSISASSQASFSCTNNGDMYAFSSCFLGLLESDAKTTSSILIRQSISKQLQASNAYSTYVPFFGGWTISPDAYKRTHATMYDMLSFSFVSPALLSISLQKQFLDFMGIFGPAVLLPLAFMLRVLPPTRTLGNMFIAVSIGVLVLFPLMYAINAAMYEAVFSDCSKISAATDDYVMGPCGTPGSFSEIAKLIPQAFFLPNFTLAVFITFLGAAAKALRVIG